VKVDIEAMILDGSFDEDFVEITHNKQVFRLNKSNLRSWLDEVTIDVPKSLLDSIANSFIHLREDGITSQAVYLSENATDNTGGTVTCKVRRM